MIAPARHVDTVELALTAPIPTSVSALLGGARPVTVTVVSEKNLHSSPEFIRISQLCHLIFVKVIHKINSVVVPFRNP